MSVKLTTLIPHIYVVKLGFTGVYIIFLLLIQNIYCGYSLEPPRRSLCTTMYVLKKDIKNSDFFQMKFSVFTAEKKIFV